MLMIFVAVKQCQTTECVGMEVKQSHNTPWWRWGVERRYAGGKNFTKTAACQFSRAVKLFAGFIFRINQNVN
jgi:hypothetical protein